MIILHGIDITNVYRDEYKNSELQEKFLNQEEINSLINIEPSIRLKTVATYWSIKEAVFKAMRAAVDLKSIKIYKNSLGYYQAFINDIEFNVSTSYEEPFLIASVWAIKD